jgi:hypothetical protein
MTGRILFRLTVTEVYKVKGAFWSSPNYLCRPQGSAPRSPPQTSMTPIKRVERLRRAGS